MTGPLDPLFAQLEKAVEDAFRIELESCTEPKYEVFLNQQRDGRLAALSAIKRHIQDTETALEKIVGLRMPDGFGPGSSLMEAKAIARAALPAREKGTEPTCPDCGRDLHGYRGPLCRYCDPEAYSE